MNRYDSIELSDAATYAADSALVTLARRVAVVEYPQHGAGMPLGDFKRAVLAGHYPELVKSAVDAVVATQVAADSSRADALSRLAAIQPPAGYTLTAEHDTLILAGPWSDDLHARLKRAGGRWDGTTGTNRRVWILPLAKVSALARLFANSAKAEAERAKAEAVAREKSAAEAAARQAQWAAERAARQAQRDAEIRARYEAPRQASPRVLFPLSEHPVIGSPVRWAGRAVVFESHGQPFRINSDHPSYQGSHLLGHESEMGAYFYYRPATAAEQAAAV